MHECSAALLGLPAALRILFRLYCWKNNIIKYRKIFHHVHLLKNKTHFVKSEPCKLLILKLCRFPAVKEHLTCGHFVHSRNAVEQCAFPRTGWSHDRYHFALVNRQVNIFQYVVLVFVHDIGLAKSLCL